MKRVLIAITILVTSLTLIACNGDSNDVFKITFDSAGGSAVQEQKVKPGDKVSIPTPPTQEDNEFLFWADLEVGKTEFDWNRSVINDLVLTAQWKKNTGVVPVSDYYKGLGIESSTGKNLQDILKTRLFDGVKIAGYGGNLNPILIDADQHPTQAGQVYTIYDGAAIASSANDTGGGGASVWNKEHVVPRSYFNSSHGSHTGDVQNLRVCRSSINTTRSSLSFANGSGGWSKVSGGFYPGDGQQGDSARISLYMMIMLPGQVTPSKIGSLEMLLRWHKEDPVDDFEIRRNGILFEFQKNRNPFIDHPELAERAFGTSKPATEATAINKHIMIFDHMIVVEDKK